jgi:hypothetical protein
MEVFRALLLLWCHMIMIWKSRMVNKVSCSYPNTLLLILVDERKPRIDYYDYYTQSCEKNPIRQTFPYVKVCSSSNSNDIYWHFRLLFCICISLGCWSLSSEWLSFLMEVFLIDLNWVSIFTIRAWSLQSLQDSILDVLLVCTATCRWWDSAYGMEYVFPKSRPQHLRWSCWSPEEVCSIF